MGIRRFLFLAWARPLVASVLALAIPPSTRVRAASSDEGPPPEFVDLSAVAPGIAIEMRYAGPDNFVGRPVRGYAAPHCLLSRPAARALAKVAHDLARQGLGLMVYDCYRPQRAVQDFVAWASDADLSTRARHYPAMRKSELFDRGYIAAHSGHSRGSTVDLTLIRLSNGARAAIGKLAGEAPREPYKESDDCRVVAKAPSADGSLDMGTWFDCFDERARTDYPGLPSAIRRRRIFLRQAMARRGFSPYAKEWWHFTLAAEPFPNRYFDFEIR